jgi:two-component system chemotaxis response regulator CheB
VIGTSAGGIAALSRIFKDLPQGFPGAILIVMHTGYRSDKSFLPEQLTRIGHIPVKLAEDGEPIRQGTAYLATAGTHLLVHGGNLQLGTGPLEHHVRPAIDSLFRSAASALGRRVIGVILTGMLSDGALGLRAVRDAGGITIVQNPREAEAGEMPRSAMRNLKVDYCLNLAEIGPVLDLLVRRAGSHKQGVLETGLASSVRLMKDRARLLAKLYDQSVGNPRTERFLQSEITALGHDIGRIQKLIPPRVVAKGRARPRRPPGRGGRGLVAAEEG